MDRVGDVGKILGEEEVGPELDSLVPIVGLGGVKKDSGSCLVRSRAAVTEERISLLG